MTFVVHANWSGGRLHLWAESSQLWPAGDPEPGEVPTHPFAPGHAILRERLQTVVGVDLEPTNLILRLPAWSDKPLPSPRFAHAVGHFGTAATTLGGYHVDAVAIDSRDARSVLDRLDDSELEVANGNPAILAAGSVRFFATAARLALHLMAQMRFVPAMRQESEGDLSGTWQPWFSDEATTDRVTDLLASMPASARACVDEFAHEPWAIVDDFIARIIDAECRVTLIGEDMFEAIEEREPSDPHVAWLGGLLSSQRDVHADGPVRPDMIRRVRRWIGGLDDRGTSSAWRLCLRLNEPLELGMLEDLQPPDTDVEWTLTFHLQSVENPDLVLDAEDIWLLPSDSITIEGHRVDEPQDLLLAELARASRLYKPLEGALDDSEPSEVSIPTNKAYEFLREIRPLLIEQGFAVLAPEWWESPATRLGARLRIDSPEISETGVGGPSGGPGSQLGLESLVQYQWEIAIGDTILSLHEFEELATRKAPLVRLAGRWVEIRPEDVAAALRFIRENPGGEMRAGEAIRLAFAFDRRDTGIPVVGMETTGWIGTVFSAGAGETLPIIEPPEGFKGTLRSYQTRGTSWLAFLERFGFGACLADDMGLGKTIQMLAMLCFERERNQDDRLAPTLLVVPMSVVGNWVHETARFCPHLKVLVHHGPERLQGDEFVDEATGSDIVVTTYALANRDNELLQLVEWHRIVLDEAQNIKNPQSKQSKAVRALQAERRVALTGTPVENRLTELWSIMDFLNPGYLGPPGTFRKRFAVPIERYHDAARSQQLREFVQPFVLRRLKTDPTVIPDLPDKVESREYTHLTREQAEMYESCVKRMLGEVEQAEGIHRRGLVLSALIKLKQICNHPAQALKDHDFSSATPPDASRSGKCARLMEMLEEVLAAGDQALVFTQFRQMGHLLATMLPHELDREVLFLHGGTPRKQRQQMVDQFQKGDGRHPIFLISLKAGGLGLNLTAATHVFHFDRWWNPAVENQATDRAYRIGQTRTVQVHKFVVSGTLEERIDAMLAEKEELAEQIIGSGERWLTELSTDQLADILTLRSEAVED